MFIIRWNNIQKPAECNGVKLIKVTEKDTFYQYLCVSSLNVIPVVNLINAKGNGNCKCNKLVTHFNMNRNKLTNRKLQHNLTLNVTTVLAFS